jgi:hypothetical protein
MSDTDGYEDTMFGGHVEPSHDTGFTTPSTVGVLKVGKTEYAIGLFWDKVEEGSKIAQAAREKAAQINADFFCVRASTVTQFGLGERRLGHRANMPSLAAHIANNRTGQFLALFEITGGYYILGVRHDGINSQLERHVADRQEAAELFEEFSVMAWDEKFAPESFGWPDTTQLRLEDALVGRAPVRLKEVNRRSSFVKIAAIAVLIGVGIMGKIYYDKLRADAQASEALQAQIDAARTTIFPNSKPEVVVPPMPWENVTAGAAMLDLCVKQINKFPLDIPGWNVTGFTCQYPNDPVGVAVLARNGVLGVRGGPVTWIKDYVNPAGYKPELVTSSNGSADQVSVQWMLYDAGQAPKYTADQTTISMSKVRDALLMLMENRMTPVTFGSTDATEFWRGTTFEFSTNNDPRDYLDIISLIPGVIIDEMTYTLGDKTWKVKGKAYEQLPLPVNAKKQ